MNRSGFIHYNNSSITNIDAFRIGAIRILPLCLAVLPWAFLCGSMAVDAGLTKSQAIAMSARVFAGAAQLMALGLVKAGVPALTILLSVFLITTQHYLYALSLRNETAKHAFKHRLLLGFLLTDELFAVSVNKQKNYMYYLLGAGICFYLCWVVFGICGVFLASSITNLDQYHLDFSIVATFIVIVVPLIKNINTLIGVIVSVVLTLIFLGIGMQSAAILAGVIGMAVATISQYVQERIK